MQLNSEIRRRRRARIEQIKRKLSRSRETGSTGFSTTVAQDELGVDHRQHQPMHGAAQPPKDPEEAWKRRMATWNEVGQPGKRMHSSAGSGSSRARWQLPAWGGLNVISLLISAVVFLLIWGLFQLPSPWAIHAQVAVSRVMQQPFHTEQAARWYDQWFGGTPSWIPIWRPDDAGEAQAVHSEVLSSLQAPAKGKIVTSFVTNKQGVHIWISDAQPILAAAEGRVIFNGHTSSGNTIVIQHPDRVRTVYGWLEDIVVEENDWVERGDPIARGIRQRQHPGEGVLYFSVREGEEYVDPAEVVNFD